MREVQTSVTNFLYCGDEYLFIQRNADRLINAGEVNGIGGKVDAGEDYVSAAIRETKEETGYEVTRGDVQFCGIIVFEGGYKKDWITCFFKIKVPHKNIPIGNEINEGKLLWIHKNNVLHSGYRLVDDLHYIFTDVVSGKKQFFMNVEVGGKELKIIKESTHKLISK